MTGGISRYMRSEEVSLELSAINIGKNEKANTFQNISDLVPEFHMTGEMTRYRRIEDVSFELSGISI